MKKQRVLELLAISKPELKERFGVTRLALFGSTARDSLESTTIRFGALLMMACPS